MKLIGMTEAAALMGVHRGTLWRHRDKGKFPVEPVVVVGNHSLYDEDQIRAAAKEAKSA